MPRKAPRQNKQIQVSDEDSPDHRRTIRRVQNEARQLQALNHNFAALAMNQNQALNEVVGHDQQRPAQQPACRTLGDYTALRDSGFQSAIAPPGIANNTWELKTGLIQMVQNNHFSGRMNEDSHQHLKHFIQMCNTVKTNGVSPESYYLRLFPFSLSDKASRWLDSHVEGTFTTRDKLAETFLQQYFPPSKTAHFKNKIISFRSIDGETLYEAWERYKELMRMCPHHNLELWQIMDTFYRGIDRGMRTLINQTAGRGLTEVPLEETYAIVEKVAQDYHLWTSDRGNPKDKKGVQDLCYADDTNDIAELTNIVKMLATKIKSLKTKSAMKPLIIANVGAYCQICGSPPHFTDGCPVMGQEGNEGGQEDANYAGQNNQGTGFTSRSAPNRWDNPNRNNPNLYYKPQNQAPPSFPYKQQQGNALYQPRGQYNNQAQPPQNNYQPRNNYNNLPQPQQDQNLAAISNIEAMLASFITEQRKTSADNDRRFQGIEQCIEHLTIHARMLENQIARQAGSTGNSHRNQIRIIGNP
ncbi:unnamed protein product [Rhodiola kirilowii]